MKTTILVADCDALLTKLISYSLEGNFTAITVNSMVDLLKCLSKYKIFDVVILGRLQPRVDNSSLVRQIKKMNPSSKLIVMSGNPFLITKFFAIGADGFISKSFKLDKLVRTINKLIEKK